MKEEDLRLLIADNDKPYLLVSKYINDFNNEFDVYFNRLNKINDAVEMLKKYGITCGGSYRTYTTSLKEKIENLKEHRKLIDKYLDERRSKCKHKYFYVSHDSHHDYYHCSLCGDEMKD